MWTRTLLALYLRIPRSVFLLIAVEVVALCMWKMHLYGDTHPIAKGWFETLLVIGGGGSLALLHPVVSFYALEQPLDATISPFWGRTLWLTLPMIILVIVGESLVQNPYHGDYAIALACCGGAIALWAIGYRVWKWMWRKLEIADAE